MNKKLIVSFTAAAALCVFLISAPAPAAKKVKESKLTEHVKKTASQWEKLFSGNEPVYEKCFSWIPDTGVRGKYYRLQSIFGIALLEKLTGEKVFLSGPHTKGKLNFQSNNDFGKYNPKFIKAVMKSVKEIIADKKFYPVAETIYKKYLKRIAWSYYNAYLHVSAVDSADIIEKYKKQMIVRAPEECDEYGCSPSYFLQEQFSAFANSLEGTDADYMESLTTPGFWIRRKIDGTDPLFYDLLTSVIKAYDKIYSDDDEIWD
jgi:hypothetical protein